MKPNVISISERSYDYIDEIIKLITSIQQQEFNIPVTIDDQPDLKDIHGFYLKGNGNFWLALHENTVVGTIALLDTGQGTGALRKMFVHHHYRGKEYRTGQQLLETLLHWTRQKHMKTVLLGTTEKFLAAHRFYEKNGFNRIDQSGLPTHFPRMAVDTIFYEYKMS